MALFGLFGRKSKGYVSPWLQLTVVYATAADGLEPDDAFALRGKVRAANAIAFEFIDPADFLAFYPGTIEGLQAANRFADAMREIVRERSVPAFGVSVQQGECLAQMSGTGRFVAKPAGEVIAQTKKLAIEDANSHPR